MVRGLAHHLWCRREENARLAIDSQMSQMFLNSLYLLIIHYQTLMVGGQAVLRFPNLSRGPL